MIIKWIQCLVLDAERENFDLAQRAWSALHTLPGFMGQLGGWDTRADDLPGCSPRTSRACILSMWENADSYARFMAEAHDPIFARASQQQAMLSCEVAIFEQLLDMPGVHWGLAQAIGILPQTMRVADCVVKPERINSFISTQGMIWLPGMAGVPGMLGGAFSRCVETPSRFLVSTIWSHPDQHTAYTQDTLLELQRQAKPDRDLTSLEGSVVQLEESWFVDPT